MCLDSFGSKSPSADPHSLSEICYIIHMPDIPTPSLKDQIFKYKDEKKPLRPVIDLIQQHFNDSKDACWQRTDWPLNPAAVLHQYTDNTRQIFVAILTQKFGQNDIPYSLQITDEQQDWAIRITFFDVINKDIEPGKRKQEWSEFTPSQIDMSRWKLDHHF
jgi:hypothetical protein